MLVLSRKVGERIHIGNDITIEVRRVSGNRVAIALQAPHDQRILRGELKAATEEFEAPGGDSGVTAPLRIDEHFTAVATA